MVGKYKYYGALMTANSNASSTERLRATQTSLHSSRTSSASHQSMVRRDGSTVTTTPQQNYEAEDDNALEDELISTNSASVPDMLNRQKRLPIEAKDEETRYITNKKGMLDNCRMTEERESSSTRGGSGHRVHGCDNSGNSGRSIAEESWNTTTTAPSSSRRTKKLSMVAYIPMEEQQQQHQRAQALKQLHNDSSHYSEATGTTGGDTNSTYPSIKIEDTSTSRRRRHVPNHHSMSSMFEGKRDVEEIRDDAVVVTIHEEEESEEDDDREIAAVTAVLSGTSSIQVVAPSPVYEDKSAGSVVTASSKVSSRPQHQQANSVHNMEDDLVQNELNADSRMAAESRNLRRHRLAKKFGHNGGNLPTEEKDRSFVSDAASSVKTNPLSSRNRSEQQHPFSTALSSHPTTTARKQPAVSLRSPIRATPMAHDEASGNLTPCSPTAKALLLAKKRRKALANKRSNTEQTTDKQPPATPSQVSHNMDRIRSKSEMEPACTSPKRREMFGFESTSPDNEQQQEERMAVGLLPHQQLHHTQDRNAKVLGHLTPPSLALPHDSCHVPKTYIPHQNHQMLLNQQKKQQQQNYHLQQNTQQQHQKQQQPPQRRNHQHNAVSGSRGQLRRHSQQHHVQNKQHLQDNSFGSSRVRAPPVVQEFQNHHSTHQQYPGATAMIEEHSAVARAVSPSSMQIASSEWTVAAEENQAMMICGPNGLQFKNMHFVRGGSGIQNALEPIGVECHNFMSKLVSTCSAISGNTYHSNSKRSQFETAAESSIFNLSAGFVENQFSKTLGPHWNGAREEIDKSNDDQSSEEELSQDGEEFSQSKDDVSREESFAASARRFLQAGNDIMGALPTDFQKMTLGVKSDMTAEQGSNTKQLGDSVQRSNEPQEVNDESNCKFQHPATNLPSQLQQAKQPLGNSYRPFPMPSSSGPMSSERSPTEPCPSESPPSPPSQPFHSEPSPSESEMVCEFQAKYEQEVSAPRFDRDVSRKSYTDTKDLPQENLDALTGVRRLRHRAFPFNVPSAENPATTTKDTAPTACKKAIDVSYDKSKVRQFFRDLNERIHKDEPAQVSKPKDRKTKQQRKHQTEYSYKLENETVSVTEKETQTKTQEKEAQVDDGDVDAESVATVAAEDSKTTDNLQDKVESNKECADSFDEAEEVFQDPKQSKSSSNHSRSASRRSEESMRTETSFQTAQNLASISDYRPVSPSDAVKFGTVVSKLSDHDEAVTMKEEQRDPFVHKEDSISLLEDVDAMDIAELLKDDDDQKEEDINMTPPSPSPSDESMDTDNLDDGSRYLPMASSLQHTFSIPDQCTTKSLETYNTDDLVSAFLAPAKDSSLKEAAVENDDGTEEQSVISYPEEPIPSNIPDDRERQDNHEQFATSLKSSSGMSDSLLGSDVEGGSSSSCNSFSEAATQLEFLQPDEELLTFEVSSPVGFQHHHYHNIVESNDQDVDELAMMNDENDCDDPTLQMDSFEQQRSGFPHTLLDVIEEEASNDDDFESLQRDGSSCLSMRQNSSSEWHVSEIDEDADIFSLQQNTDTQDSLSADEVDAKTSEEDTIHNPVVPEECSTEDTITRKASSPVLPPNVILKFVFMFVMMYYISLIFNFRFATETFLQQQLHIDVGTIWSPRPESAAQPRSRSQFANHESEVDWQHLTRLVQEALYNYRVQEESASSLMEISVVPTRNPGTEWERDLDHVLLEHKALLHRVKAMIRRHANSHDASTSFFRDEELAKELRSLKMEKQASQANDNEVNQETTMRTRQ